MRKKRDDFIMLVKMYRSRKLWAVILKAVILIHLASASSIKCDSRRARFRFFFALSFVLGLFLFYALSFSSFSYSSSSIRSLVSLVLQRLQIYPGPEGGSLALAASASDCTEQSSHGHTAAIYHLV